MLKTVATTIAIIVAGVSLATAAAIPAKSAAPKLPAAQAAQQQPVTAPAGAVDTLQSAFTATPQQAFQKTIHITNPGVVTITATVTGAPVAIYLRTATGTVLATATVGQPSGRLTYNLTPANLQGGYAFNVAMTTAGNASGSMTATYPKVDQPKLTAWLAAQPKQTPPVAKPATPAQQAAKPAAPAAVTPAVAKLPAGPLLSGPTLGGAWRSNLRAGKVALANGVNFNAQDYINLTSIRNHPTLKNIFSPGFQQHLTAPVKYSEEVQEGSDRLVITRHLEIATKDPCAPGIEATAGISLCFKPDIKVMPQETKDHIVKIRTKISNYLRANPNGPDAAKYKQYEKLNDIQLLDQVLNKQSPTKRISFQSVVPYKAYQFRMIPQMDLFNFNVPLPTANQTDFRNMLPAVIPPDEIQTPGADLRRGIARPAAFSAPSIQSITPDNGFQGETIVIRGANLDKVTSATLKAIPDNSLYPQTIIDQKPDMLLMTNEGPGQAHKIALGWSNGLVESAQPYQVKFIPQKGSPPPVPPFEFENVHTIDTKFLTGFTYGKSYGHHYFIEFAEETAITDRYYASFRYNFSAGFGLRWPFQVTGTATVDKVYNDGVPSVVPYSTLKTGPYKLCKGDFYPDKNNVKYCGQGATVTLQATPVDGDPAFYAATGLPQDKIFEGKEFVFEVGATCRFHASIPGPNITYNCPDALKGFDFGKHFAPQLGGVRRNFANITQSGRELGLAIDFGAAYVAFNPGMTIQGDKGKFSLDVTGLNATPSKPVLDLEAGPASFTLAENAAAATSWGFEVTNPRYGLNVLIAPSIEVELGAGIGPFSWNTKFGPFTIDALAIDLGRFDFTRHERTNSGYRLRDVGLKYYRPAPVAPPAQR